LGGAVELDGRRLQPAQLQIGNLGASALLFTRIVCGLRPHSRGCKQEREFNMDSTMIIRIAAGALFVIVLVVLIQRRRTRVK